MFGMKPTAIKLKENNLNDFDIDDKNKKWVFAPIYP